jgi:hypothetical protein
MPDAPSGVCANGDAGKTLSWILTGHTGRTILQLVAGPILTIPLGDFSVSAVLLVQLVKFAHLWPIENPEPDQLHIFAK